MSTYIRTGDTKLPAYEDICQIVRDYLRHIVIIEGRSIRTANQYYLSLRGFIRFIRMSHEFIPEEKFDEIDIRSVDEAFLQSVTRQDISDYIFFLSQRGNSLTTRKDKLTTLRSFYTYLVNQRGFSENPALYIKLPKRPQRESKYLSSEEVQKMLDAALKQPNPERDYCMTVLFLNCGLRLSELCGLNTDSFRDNGTFRVIGKGNKERTAYMNGMCVNALVNWLRVRQTYNMPQDDRALFCSKLTKKRLTNRAIQKVIENELMQAGLSGQGYSVHKLRHTAATMMYEGGADLMELKEILGHEHTTTTEIYTHINKQRLQEISTRVGDMMPEPTSPPPTEDC